MSLILSGTDGLSDVDGTAATPAIRGTDANTGIFFPAADTIAFSEGGAEAMRIDSAGNVGIGTTSPESLGGFTFLQVGQTNAGIVQTFDGATKTAMYSVSGEGRLATRTNHPLVFHTNGSECARITAAGNVGIGSSSVISKLQVVADQASYVNDLAQLTITGTNTNQRLLIGYNTSTDKAFIQATKVGTAYQDLVLQSGGGNLMVGTTSSQNGNTSYSFENNSTILNTAWFQNANASTGTSVLVATAARTASSAFTFIDCGANYPTSFTRQFLVRGDGVIFAQNTTVQSLSDIRTKENVRDSEDGLQIIMGVRPVRFDFKEGFGNERKNVLGFVAQEIETVFPDAVDISFVDPDGEGPEDPYKSVGPAALIPVLVKAIQEQQALIQSLTTRITALETPVVTPAVTTPPTGTQA